MSEQSLFSGISISSSTIQSLAPPVIALGAYLLPLKFSPFSAINILLGEISLLSVEILSNSVIFPLTNSVPSTALTISSKVNFSIVYSLNFS
ncbi:hypothetical protein D3C81_604910 [compost metagenome]